MNIQPNVNVNTSDFNFSQQNTKTSEKSFSDLSFAEALKAAYKNDRFSDDENSNSSKIEEQKEEKVETSANDDKVAEREEKVEVKEKTDSSKTEKIAKKDDEKNEKSVESVDEKNTDVAEKNIVVAQNVPQNQKINVEVEETVDSKIEIKVDSNSKNIATKINLSEENKTEDFDVDIEELISSKVAKNLTKEETKVENKIQQNVPSNEKIVESQSNVVVSNSNVAKKDSSKSEKNVFEKLTVHDLRTQKVDVETVDSSKIAKIKTEKVEVKTEKDSKKTEKIEKFVKNDKILNVNQNLHNTTKAKNVTQNELKVAYNQETQDSVQFTMELANKANQNITASSTQTAAATGSDFQQMLSNTVQQNVSEFVKAGNIVLKDNNQGMINLIMKPESLGNVKISLSLSDKTISGQIIVASKEAYDAFKDNIEAIKQAFTQSGFETGSFDLDFSNQQNFAQNGQGENPDSQNLNQKNAIAHADKSYGDLVTSEGDSANYESSGNHSVNIVA